MPDRAGSEAMGWMSRSGYAPAAPNPARARARGFIARAHFDGAASSPTRATPRPREHAQIAGALGKELGMTGPFGVVPRGEAPRASL